MLMLNCCEEILLVHGKILADKFKGTGCNNIVHEISRWTLVFTFLVMLLEEWILIN
jgi:hypothetical protein